MKHKIFTLIVVIGVMHFSSEGQPGALDRSFGSYGEVIFYGYPQWDFIYTGAIAIQADGKIVETGTGSFENCEFDHCGSIQLSRWNLDGSPDSTFGGSGRIDVIIGNTASSSSSLAIQTDGKIVVAGAIYYGDSWNNSNSSFAIVRIKSNGSLDSSFDSDGIAITSLGNIGQASSVAIQSDGKIVVAGFSDSAFNLTVIRYNTNGLVDSTFGKDGKAITALQNEYYPKFSLAIQPDGKILVAGSSHIGLNQAFMTVRYNPNGSLDKYFGTNGIVATPFRNSDAYVNSIAIESDGKIVEGGGVYNGSDEDFAVVRYNSNGSFDCSFGKNGKVITDLYNSISSIVVQSDGKILAAGSSRVYGEGVLVRYNHNGSIDNTFGKNGSVTTAILHEIQEGFIDYYLNALVIQKDLKIVAGGTFYDGEADGTGMFLERINGDGASFSVVSKVSYIGNPISFTNLSANAASSKWDFDGDGIFDSKAQNPHHTYSSAGVYNVKLRVNDDSLLEETLPITILPNRGTPYTLDNGGNFEAHATDFAADNIGPSQFGRGSFAGIWGPPHSGSNAWGISYYSPNSTAYLYTPSFNCTTKGSYTVSFYIAYIVENTRDGFRIEYSRDKGNTWKPLGTSVKPDWYDYNNPDKDGLFPQGEAYFSLNNTYSYTKKTFTTNIFEANSSVTFRVVFKSDASGSDLGLALDDFTLTGPTNVALSVNLISSTGVNTSFAATENKSTNGFQVYPNPAKDILHVQTNGKATLTLTDQSGKILFTKPVNGKGEINVANLAAGLYYLKTNETGGVQKVIIAR